MRGKETIIHRAAEDPGLSPAELRILAWILPLIDDRNPVPIPAQNVAQALSLSRPSVTRALDRLVSTTWLHRSRTGTGPYRYTLGPASESTDTAASIRIQLNLRQILDTEQFRLVSVTSLAAHSRVSRTRTSSIIAQLVEMGRLLKDPQQGRYYRLPTDSAEAVTQ